MHAHPLRFRRRQRARLVEDRGGDAVHADVVQQRRTSHGGDVSPRETGVGRGPSRKVGHAAGVTRPGGGPQVGEVRDRFELDLGEAPLQRGLPGDQGLPIWLRRRITEDVGRRRAERVDDPGVELLATPGTSHVHGGVGSLGAVEQLDGLGDMEQPHGQSDLLPGDVTRHTSPVPAVNTCCSGPHTSVPRPRRSAIWAVVRQWDRRPRWIALPPVTTRFPARRIRCSAGLPAPTWRSMKPSMGSPARSTWKLSRRKAMSSPNQAPTSGVSATQPTHASVAT